MMFHFIDNVFYSDISTKTTTKVIVLLAKFYYIRSNIIIFEIIILTKNSKIASLDGISILRLDILESPLPSPSSVRLQGKLMHDPFPDSPDFDFQHQCNNLCLLKLCIPIMEFSTNNVW